MVSNEGAERAVKLVADFFQNMKTSFNHTCKSLKHTEKLLQIFAKL